MSNRKKPIVSTAFTCRNGRIDPSVEVLIPLKNTTEIGANVHWKTLWVWQSVGCRSRVNGAMVKLETVFEGDSLCTTREAYQRFLAKLNAPPTKKRSR
jgi:hypothetical protein